MLNLFPHFPQGPSASAYVTYQRSEDALRAIQSINNIVVDSRVIKTSLGTTKYCSHFMKNQVINEEKSIDIIGTVKLKHSVFMSCTDRRRSHVQSKKWNVSIPFSDLLLTIVFIFERSTCWFQ